MNCNINHPDTLKVAPKQDDSNLSDLSLSDCNDSPSAWYDASSSPKQITKMSLCCNQRIVSYQDYDSCFKCGVYIPKNGAKSFKSSKMNFNAFFSPKTIYETMIKRSQKFSKSTNPEYTQLRPSYVDWIINLADKFNISMNSAHLGVHLLDMVMCKQPNLVKKIQLYAQVCFLLAAKTIELDERIPYIPKIKKITNSKFTLQDYSQAELAVLDIVDWNPQYTSAVEFLEFFQAQGILFSSDGFKESLVSNSIPATPKALQENNQNTNTSTDNKSAEKKKYFLASSTSTKENISTEPTENSFSFLPLSPTCPPINKIPFFTKQHSMPTNSSIEQPIEEPKLPLNGASIKAILSFIDMNYITLTNLLVKDNDFMAYEPKIVAAAAVAFFRSINKLNNEWNRELEAITKMKYSEISACFDLILKKYKNKFLPPREHLPQIPTFKPSTNENQIKKANSLNTNTQINAKLINLYSVSSPRNNTNSSAELDTTTSTSDGKQSEKKVASTMRGVLTNSSSSSFANQNNMLHKSKSTLNVENQKKFNVGLHLALSKENSENVMKTEPQTCRNSTTNSIKLITPEYVLHAKLGVCKQ
jgi:hypothetical protein